MSKHTPGPWRVVDDYGIKDGTFERGGDWIADADVRYISYAKPPDSVKAANARLIASAPELLEALEWVLASSTNAGRHDWTAIIGANDLEAFSNLIKKAKGELQ